MLRESCDVRVAPSVISGSGFIDDASDFLFESLQVAVHAFVEVVKALTLHAKTVNLLAQLPVRFELLAEAVRRLQAHNTFPQTRENI